MQQQLDNEKSAARTPTESTIETLRRQEATAEESKGKTYQNNDLLSNLISRKLVKAQISMKKNSYSQAKEDLKAVLKLDPNNKDAKQMLSQIPS